MLGLSVAHGEWAFWAAGAPPSDAGSYCAQQAKGSANKTCAPNTRYHTNIDHGSICPTAYCVSNVTGEIAFCTSALGVPEQINIQIAGPDAVVVVIGVRRRGNGGAEARGRVPGESAALELDAGQEAHEDGAAPRGVRGPVRGVGRRGPPGDDLRARSGVDFDPDSRRSSRSPWSRGFLLIASVAG